MKYMRLITVFLAIIAFQSCRSGVDRRGARARKKTLELFEVFMNERYDDLAHGFTVEKEVFSSYHPGVEENYVIVFEISKPWDEDPEIKDRMMFYASRGTNYTSKGKKDTVLNYNGWWNSGIKIFQNEKKIAELERLANLDDEYWEDKTDEEIERIFAKAYNIKWDHWLEISDLVREKIRNKELFVNGYFIKNGNKYSLSLFGPAVALPIFQHFSKKENLLECVKNKTFSPDVSACMPDARYMIYYRRYPLWKQYKQSSTVGNKKRFNVSIVNLMLPSNKSKIGEVIEALPDYEYENNIYFENLLKNIAWDSVHHPPDNTKEEWKKWYNENKDHLYFKYEIIFMEASHINYHTKKYSKVYSGRVAGSGRYYFSSDADLLKRERGFNPQKSQELFGYKYRNYYGP